MPEVHTMELLTLSRISELPLNAKSTKQLKTNINKGVPKYIPYSGTMGHPKKPQEIAIANADLWMPLRPPTLGGHPLSVLSVANNLDSKF